MNSPPSNLASRELPAVPDEVFADLMSRMELDFVPNFFKALAPSTMALRGVWAAVDHVLLDGAIPRVLKEAALYAIAASRDCHYCHHVHLAICTQMGMDADAYEQLEGKERAMLQFAIQCARAPQSATADERQRLLELGVSEAEISELVAFAGLAVMLTIIADANEVELDAELSGGAP